mgnify:FL=1
MKKALSLVFVLILMLGFVACKSNETGDIDTFAPNENSSGVESIALGVQTVELCLDAVSDDAQQTEEFLSTNTTKIVVSAKNMERSAEVELFLYSKENTTEPILYATLTKSAATVTFSNLTSATAYKVAGKINNGTTFFPFL